MIEPRRLSRTSAAEFLDFAATQRSGKPISEHWRRLASAQLDGAVALYNRLMDRRVAWLADEVGLGKTFVALGVAALFRHEHPHARILLLLPSSRLLPQWERVMGLFTQTVVQQVDHRARTSQGTGSRPIVRPTKLLSLARDLLADADRDVLAPLSAFSFGLGSDGDWQAVWRKLAVLSPQLPTRLPPWAVRDKGVFKDVYAAALNILLPSFDLVICDESHNLKAGASHSAARNRMLAAALGGIRREEDHDWPWTAAPLPRVDRLLCLTATPVERSFAEMSRQAEVFGFHEQRADIPQSTRTDLAALRAGSSPDLQAARGAKDAARRFTIRRLHELHAHGASGLTKNQYRREWRQGGLATHDDPMQIPGARERLVVALVQKRVLEVLESTRQGASADRAAMPSFQMGLLSSFESFHKTLENKKDEATHDGKEQTHDAKERQGLDSASIDQICSSYRAAFGTPPPHPKMDQTAKQLARWALAGDKSLVFVRRVRTTEELADKVAQHLSEALVTRMTRSIPSGLAGDWVAMVEGWRASRRDNTDVRPLSQGGKEDEAGASATFFSWLFWGGGDRAHHQTFPTGASLRRQCFNDAKHPWSTFFHDNHVRWLVESSEGDFHAWVARNEASIAATVPRFFGSVQEPGPRHIYEAWQAAGLWVLEQTGHRHAAVSEWLRLEWYGKPGAARAVEVGSANEWLTRATFFDALRRSSVGKSLWPTGSTVHDPSTVAGERRLRRREIQREVMAAALRIGQAQVDVFLAAVRIAGALSVPGSRARGLEGALVDELLRRLAVQLEGMPEVHAAFELQAFGDDDLFDRIVDVNFPQIYDKRLPNLRAHFLPAQIGRQSPAVAVRGGLDSERVTRQFRMPGYPLVIVSTDVLQEGVDLHTFCGRVVHYGISHSSAGSEQRTGRVDRIGSLVHRRVDLGAPDTLLQVHYPHLQDTIEPVQVARLYRRMNHFMQMVHDDLSVRTKEDSKIQLDLGQTDLLSYEPPPTGKLKSAFQVQKADLVGQPLTAIPQGLAQLEDILAAELRAVMEDWSGHRVHDTLCWRAEVFVRADGKGDIQPASGGAGWRRQPVSIELRSGRRGQGFLLRAESPIGRVSIETGQRAGAWLTRDEKLVGARLVQLRGKRGDKRMMSVRSEAAVRSVEQLHERLPLVARTVAFAADQLEQHFLPNQDLALADWSER